MSRPTTSCKLPVAHYRSVDSPGPVVVFLLLFASAVQLCSTSPLLLPLDLPVVPGCKDDLESFLLFVCLMDLTDICNVGGPVGAKCPSQYSRHPLLVSFSSPSWYRDVSRAPLVSLLKRWNWFGCLFFCCLLFDGQNRFCTSGRPFLISAHLRSFNQGCVIDEVGFGCFPPEREISGVCQIA